MVNGFYKGRSLFSIRNLPKMVNITFHVLCIHPDRCTPPKVLTVISVVTHHILYNMHEVRNVYQVIEMHADVINLVDVGQIWSGILHKIASSV